MKKNIKNKKIKRKNYLEFLAAFMIVLILTIPFYVSNAFAQAVPSVEDAGQSCIDKHKKTNDLVEILDNDIISTLEQILSVLHAISGAWTAAKAILDVVIIALYATGFDEIAATIKEKYRNAMECPFCGTGLFGQLLHYLTTCQIPGVVDGATGKVALKSLGFCSIGKNVFDSEIDIRIGPFDNIITATACLCLPGILFNIRKLKTIYQTYNCCVEQACVNGISTEACERQLNEATCMYWGSGALLMGIVHIAFSVIGQLLFQKLVQRWIPENQPLVGTLLNLANIPFEFQALLNSLDWMRKTFDEPTCEDLGFDKLKEQSRKEISYQSCQWIDTDRPPDGRYDRLSCT